MWEPKEPLYKRRFQNSFITITIIIYYHKNSQGPEKIVSVFKFRHLSNNIHITVSSYSEFQLSGITTDYTKYGHLIKVLDAETLKYVR